MSTAALDGHTATSARVHRPAWGCWWADVSLDVEAELSGATHLDLADLAFEGTIVSGGPSQGTSRYRIAGGAGWGKVGTSRSYANDLGVKASTVLLDAASEAGEGLDPTTLPTSKVGSSFTRDAAPLSDVLEFIAPQGWYVGEDGITRIGRRAAAEFDGEATRTRVDPARGTIELAAEQLAELRPGVIVDGLEAVDVVHDLDGSTLRTTIWGAGVSSASRALGAFARLVELLTAETKYHALYEYRVVSQQGERLNLQPVRVSLGMPDLRRVRVRPGVPGCRADHALGSLVLVSFVNADPARPVVVGFSDAESPGFAPDRLDLVGEDDAWVLGTQAGRVVRYGDVIAMPVGAGAVPTGVAITGIATPGVPTTTVSRVRA